MFYLLFVPVFVLMFFELRYLLGLRKHDRVLFPFCNIRRELMTLLRDHHQDLSVEDYLYARNMLNALSHTVSIYRDHKSRFFNFRAFLRFLRAYQSSADEIAKIPRTKHPQLQAMEQQLNWAMFRGFMAYTPFLRSEIVVRVLLAIMTFLGNLGVKFLSRRIDDISALVADVRKQAEEFGEQSQILTTA